MKRQNRSGIIISQGRRGTGLVVLTAAAMAWASQRTQAATLNWDPTPSTDSTAGGGAGTWDLISANWFNGVTDTQWTDVSPAGTDVAVFGGSIGTVNLASSLSAAELIFSSTGSTPSTGYALNGANTLSLGSATVGALNVGIDASTLTTGTTSIGAPINIVSAVTDTWTIGGGSTIVDTGGVSGAVALSKAGNGILTLSVDNPSLSGGVQLSGGQLNINSANALGSGAFSISTSFLDNTSNAALTDNASAIRLNGTLTFIGTNNLNLGSGTVTIGASRVINTKVNNVSGSSNLELDGPFVESGTGGYSLTKEGSGTLTLTSSANAWTGVPAAPAATVPTPEIGTVLIGGTLDLSTTGQLPNVPLAFGGGQLNISNTGSGARTQTINAAPGLAPYGSVGFGTGQNIITLNNSGTGSITFTAGSVSRTLVTPSNATTFGAQGTTELFRGTNLGVNAPSSSSSTNIIFSSPPSLTVGQTNTDFFSATGNGTLSNGTTIATQAAVLRGALVDTSATGGGIGFATYDPTNGVRLLNNAKEQLAVTTSAAYTAASTGDNVYIHNVSIPTTAGKQTNTLQIDNNSGTLTAGPAITFTNSGSALDPRNGLLFTGNSPITLTGGTLTGSGADTILLSLDSAPVTIGTALNDTGSLSNKNVIFGGTGSFIVNASIAAATNGGFFINGATVTDNAAATVSSNGFEVNGGGTLILGGTFALSSSRPFLIGSGSTVDMHGISLANVDYLGDGTFGSGGTITNLNNTTVSTLTLQQGSSVGNARNFTGIIAGNINLVRGALGTVTQTQTLSGASTYTGSTLISSGALRIGVTNTLPVSTPLTINGGGAVAQSLLDLNGFNQTVGSLAGAPNSGSATIANNTASTASVFTVSGSAATAFGGVIVDNTGTGGTVGLGVRGTGILSLTGNNTYSGGTTIYGGTLKANNATGSTGSGFVTVNSGGILAGTGTIGGTGGAAGLVTVNSGGHIAPGDNSLSNLTIGTGGSLALAGSSLLDFDFTNTSSDEVIVNGGLTLNASNTVPIDLNVLASGTTGRFVPTGASGTMTLPIIQYTGAALSSSVVAGDFTVANPVGADTYSFATGAGPGGTNVVNLTIVFPKPEVWTGGTSSGWEIGNNWNPVGVPSAPGTNVIFPSVSNTLVNLDGNKTIGSMSFTGGSYSIQPGSGSGTLTLDNSGFNATIASSSGTSHIINVPLGISSPTIVNTSTASDMITISGAISGSGPMTASGSGTLALTGNNSAYFGGVTITGGSVLVNTANSLGASSATAVINSGTLEVAAPGFASSRNFQLGSATSNIQIDGGGTYELDGNVTDVSPSTPGTLNLITPSGGTLILAGGGTVSNTGGINIPSNAILQLGNSAGTTGTTVSGGTLTNAGVINVGSSGAGLGAATTVTLGSSLAGAGALNFNPTAGVGSGTLVLAGSNSGFSSPVTMNNGTLVLGNTLSTTATGTGSLTLNNMTLTESGATSQIGNNAVGGNTTTATPATAAENLTFAGTVTINTGAGTMTIADQFNGGSATVPVTINRNAGSGTLVLGVSGNGLIGVTAPFNNTLFGTFSNTSGSVTFAGRGSTSTNVAYSFTAPTGTISVGNVGGTINLGSLSGTQPITGTNAGARIGVGALNTTTAYSGVISSANIGIAKTGTGTFTLSGQNTYSGVGFTAAGLAGTAVLQGTLIAGSSADLVGGTFGPFGPTNGGTAVPNYVLIGNSGNLSNATLLANPGITVANPLVVSGGSATATSTAFTLGIGGAGAGVSSYTGAVTLENDVTLSQAAGGQVNFTSGITGTDGSTGPDTTTVIQHSANQGGTGDSGANNSGFQTINFVGPGSTVVSGTANATSNPSGFGIFDSNDPTLTINSVSLGFYTGLNGFISANVTGGTTTFASANQYSGSTTVSGGQLVLANLPTALAARSVHALNISGGNMQVAQSPTHAGRNVLVAAPGFFVANVTPPSNSGPTPVAEPALTISGTGTLDLTNNDMIVQGVGAAGLATVNSELKSGFSGNPAGAWTGTGITTSTGTIANSPKSNIGLADVLAGSTTSFDGQTVGANDVIVKFTYFGDSNIDGKVNATDYIAIDNGFNSRNNAIPLTGWQNGDFNYDGVINGDDYTLIDNAFNTQGGVVLNGISAGPAEMIASNTDQIAGASASAVPEPTTLGMLAIGGAGLLMRRRRRAR